MDRRRLTRIVWMCGLAVGALALLWVPISAVHDMGVFELDGDAVDSPSVAGDDWNTVNAGSRGSAVARTGVLTDPGNTTIFTGGGSKDPNDISSWAWKNDSGGLPDKDNITNAYAAAYNVNGDLVIYFGADRFANDGDAQLGFWFFQQNVTTNVSGTFNGVHQVGDILVLANLTNGGAVVTIQVLEWVGTGGDQHGGTLQLLLTETAAKCGPGLADNRVCAISNAVPTSAPWEYTPKSGSPGVFPQFSFFEGGINITEIFAGTTPPCFASFMTETRSSQSVNAVLKDFVLGAFPVCGINIVKACPSSRPNADQTAFIYDVNGTVTNTGFAPLYDVVVVDDAGTPGNVADDFTFSLGTLAGGASATFSGSFESTLNPPTNTASVTAATTPGGPTIVTDVSEPVTCPQVLLNKGIAVSKNCEVRLVVENNRVVVQVNFGGLVSNTGQVILDNVTVTDDAGTPTDTSDDQLVFGPATVRPGQEFSFVGSYKPTTTFTDNPSSASFTDTVTAEGVARFGLGRVRQTASATCPLCP
jgi:hypothetical protein